MAKIVQISEAASLAIHAMVLIARAENQINVNVIADHTGASRNHLAKVMQRLVKDGYLKSTRGPLGGFVLNKKAKDINFLEIYESIEGTVLETTCPLDRPVCPFDKCLMGGLVTKLTNEFKDYMKGQTLDLYIEA